MKSIRGFLELANASENMEKIVFSVFPALENSQSHFFTASPNLDVCVRSQHTMLVDQKRVNEIVLLISLVTK